MVLNQVSWCFAITRHTPSSSVLGLRDTGFGQRVGREWTGHVPHLTGASRAPTAPMSRLVPRMRDLEQHREGFCVCSWSTAATFITWAGDKRLLWWGSETWGVTVTVANSATAHVCTHTHTHTLQYKVMRKSGKVSEKSQQLSWSLKVLPKGYSSPLKFNVCFWHLSQHNPPPWWPCSCFCFHRPAHRIPHPAEAHALLWCPWITVTVPSGPH